MLAAIYRQCVNYGIRNHSCAASRRDGALNSSSSCISATATITVPSPPRQEERRNWRSSASSCLLTSLFEYLLKCRLASLYCLHDRSTHLNFRLQVWGTTLKQPYDELKRGTSPRFFANAARRRIVLENWSAGGGNGTPVCSANRLTMVDRIISPYGNGDWNLSICRKWPQYGAENHYKDINPPLRENVDLTK